MHVNIVKLFLAIKLFISKAIVGQVRKVLKSKKKRRKKEEILRVIKNHRIYN